MRVKFPFRYSATVKNYGSTIKYGFVGFALLCVLMLCNVVRAQPTITSISQMAGAPGSTVTISGSNFNTAAANNVVYFGATQATVNSASATSLNVTVPYGSTFGLVTVDNIATNLTAFSQYPFLPDYNNSAYVPHSINFDGKINFTDPGNPSFSQTLIEDINGDGKPDMIVIGAVVSIYINTSTSGSITSGSFAAPVDIAVPGTTLYSGAAGDIDGDGKPDLAFCTGGNDSIYIFRNTTTGGSVSFAPVVAFLDSSTYFFDYHPGSIAIIDMDGDGKADIVTNSYGNIAIMRNTATAGTITSGSLAAPAEFAAIGSNDGTGSMVVSDLDGDGKPDIAIADGWEDAEVYKNNSVPGTLNFGPAIDFYVGSQPWGIVSVDIDGDGKPDLATVNFGDNTLSILRNTSTPGTINSSSFAAPMVFATRNWPWSITTGDFDGDGKPDLAITSEGDETAYDPLSQAVIIFRNTATTGTIDTNSLVSETDPIENFNYSGYIAAGDLDGDGKADLIALNWGTTSLSILRNDPLYLPPTITTVSPNIDSAGTTVTITGTNFNVNAANDIVYFGAVQATVNAASATSLTVTVPTSAGYAPITVNNTLHGLTAFSPQSFLPDFNNIAYVPGTVNFDSPVSFVDSSGIYYQSVVMADLDGDGKPDMIVLGGSVAIYRNISVSGSITSGSFAAPIEISASGNIVTAGDIDGDGKPDLVICNGSYPIQLLHNTSTPGSISFGAPVSFYLNYGDIVSSVAIGDIDGDGKPDVTFGTADWGNIGVFQNISTVGTIDSNSLEPAVDYYYNYVSTYDGIAISDIDGDGKPDVVCTDNANSQITVFRNICLPGNFTNAFAQPVTFATGNQPNGIVTTDIDGDGKPDIAAANMADNTISLLRNISTPGTISFESQVVLLFTGMVQYIATGDFDGDGKPDLALANISNNTISVLRNTSVPGTINTSSFATQINFATGNFATGNAPAAIFAGDVDGDGKADLININIGGSYGSVSVLRNDPLLTFPTITLVSPIADSPGTSVTITGTGFNTTAANDIVYFGATRATVNSASATSLSVTVPVGATYDFITVDNTLHGRTAFSPYSFLPDYNNSPYVPGTVKFDAHVDFNGSGSTPLDVVIADIDGDGKPDMVAMGVSNISVYLNTSTSGSITSGSFAPPVNFTIPGGDSYAIAAGDIDGDGKPDVVVTDGGGDSIFVLRNTSTVGAANFAPAVSFVDNLYDFPTGVAIIDVDSDGRADIVTANGNGISVFLNTATAGTINSGSLSAPVDFLNYSGGNSVAVGDIDGDGKPDVAVTDQYNNVWVYQNTCSIGVANFGAPVNFTTGNGSWDVIISDIDGDGKPDLGVVNEVDNTLSLLRNTSTTGTIDGSSFAGQVVFATGSGPYHVSAGDFDGDGKTDLVVSNQVSSTVSIFRNTATTGVINTSSLATRVDSTSGNGPGGIAVCDIDGDHKADIITANTGDATLSVLRNDPLSLSSITGNASVCVGSTTALTDASAGGTWSSSNTSFATVGSTGVVTGVAAGTAVISYITFVTTATITVTVSTPPNAGSISGATNVCVGSIISLSDAAGGGVWSTGSSNASVDGSGNVTGVAGGTATISYTVTNGCGSVSVTDVVNVTALPGAINGNPSVCASDETITALSDNTPGGIWSSYNTGIAVVGSTGIVRGVTSYTTTATDTVTVFYTTACGAANIVVTVHPAPSAITGSGVGGGLAGVCVGGTLALSDATAGGTWSINNTTEATINSSGVVAAFNYTGFAGNAILYTTEYGCYADVDLNVLPAVTAITGSAVVCQGATTALSDSGPYSSWMSSNAGIAAIGSTGVVTGVSGGTAIITFEDYNSTPGCLATITVTVNSTTLTAGTITGAAIVCVGAMTNLSDATSGGVWSSGSTGIATVGTGGVVMGIAPGSATISYTVTNSCGSAHATHVVTVSPATSAGTIGGATSVNVGSNITLTDVVSGGMWSAGNTNATVSGGVVTGVTAGTVTISYAVTGACGTAYVTRLITVNNSSIPGINGNTAVCVGATTSLSDAVTGGVWSSSNGVIASVGSTGIVTGANAGTVTISYTQGSVYSVVTVTVNRNPTAIQGTWTECAGTTIPLTDITAGGSWSGTGEATVSGTGTSGTLVAGAFAGTAMITYTLPTGCYAASLNTIAPNPTPILGLTTVCVGGLTILSDASTDMLQWTSSNTAVATSAGGYITGVSVGSATITYKILPDIGTSGTGCMTTTIVNVVAPPSGITGNTGALCPGAAMSLTDGSGIWTSSNGAIAIVGSASGIVTAITGGTATITYSESGASGCMAKTIVTVSAVPSITGTTTVCIGGTTALHDAVTGGTWSSAGGNATVGATGVVTGLASGTAIITYTTAGGCMGTDIVMVSGASAAISGNLFLCEGTTTTLSDASAGGTWSMSSSIASVAGSTGAVTASASLTGTATVSYTSGSCSATAVLTVNAKPAPIQGATSECAGVTITLSDATAGGTWSGAGDATVSGTGTAGTLIAGGVTGAATVTYTIGTGCMATMANTVYTVQPIMGNFNLCVGLVTDLSDASPAYSWTSSNTAIAIASGPDISGEGAGVATITFKSSSAGNCITTQTVTVNALPVVAPINGPATISHAGGPVSISDATAGGVWTSSNTSVIVLAGSTGNPIAATAQTTTGSSVITYAVTISGCTAKVTKTFGATAASHPAGTATVLAGSAVSLADDAAGGAWSSSDIGIATVDGSGLVTGVTPGNVMITHKITADDGGVGTSVTEVTVSAIPVVINVLPNPNKGTFGVKGTLGGVADETVTLEVTDLLGQVIYRNKVTAYGGRLDETIMLSNALANGMYILNVQSGTEKKTLHFVIEQ